MNDVQPAVPDPDEPFLSADGPAEDATSGGQVGAFRQGTAASRWALARYLVGRAIGESVGSTLLVVLVVLLALAVLVQTTVHATFVTVVLCLAALAVLLLRWILLTLLRKLTAVDQFGPVEERLRRLVADTRSDVLRELRRIGLPSHRITLPLLAFRLLGRRRGQVLERLRSFDLGRAVPAARVDELHLLLRSTVGGSRRGAS